MSIKPAFKAPRVFRRSALALALGACLASGMVYAQSTTGRVFGNAEVSQTIKITSATGAVREAAVGANGAYVLRDLPVGQYKVEALKNGAVVNSHTVTVVAGSGTQVNFNVQELAAVEVSASAVPAIDVSSATPSLTLTAAQLKHLPVAQTAEDIALLAPGVVEGSAFFQRAVTFMGAGITENAYYVNGYNTTALYNYTGTSFQMPYGAIAQQDVLIGGYGAKYGRADGGVISQIGKRGTNQWHFGGQLQVTPRSMRSDPVNNVYPEVELTGTEVLNDTTKHPGDLYQYRNENKTGSFKYSAYAGGALVQDKLFVYIAGQNNSVTQKYVYPVAQAKVDFTKSHNTSWYGKIDWNINNDNLFEYTRLQSDSRNGYGRSYVWDGTANVEGNLKAELPYGVNRTAADIYHYTSYLSDEATLSILYGKMQVNDPTLIAGAPSSLPYIAGLTEQDPLLTGGTPITNGQPVRVVDSPTRQQNSTGLRVDFSYQLGDHLLSVGLDNLNYTAQGVGQSTTGPGYAWNYGHGNPGDNINAALHVGKPGGTGYYVSKLRFNTASAMSATQTAWYLQDEWQFNDRWLLSLGLRNDSFKNMNPAGVPFVTQQNQYAPRLGVTWDVNGDSSLKIYANAGRYYLALPQAAANRSATATYYTNEYFTYSGIDADGQPTGLAPVQNDTATGPAGEVSANNEFGNLPDPLLIASKNLKAQYQDELIFGFDKSIWTNWVFSTKATYRRIGNIIDDGCTPAAINKAVVDAGYTLSDWDTGRIACHSFNPGGDNEYLVYSNDGKRQLLINVPFSASGFPDKPQREYYGINLTLQHPFDGTWWGRLDYTFSRSWGNTEGQVRSDIGQGDISLTEDWDYPELMVGARGYLANDRRHQIKAMGGYQLTPEVMLTGTLSLQSGGPISCLGFYGEDPTNSATNNPGYGYGSDYHWCEGKIWTPGQERTSWTNQLDLGVTYTPSFANDQLSFSMYVFNALNSQKATQLQAHRFSRFSRTVRTDYLQPLSFQAPRYFQFTLSYDY